MGKGDVKSKKGKRILGSFGVRRKARKQNVSVNNTAFAQGDKTPPKGRTTRKKTA
jgi:ribosomal small subunit protein bTHX